MSSLDISRGLIDSLRCRWACVCEVISDHQFELIARILTTQGINRIQDVDVIDWIGMKPGSYGLTHDDLIRLSKITIKYSEQEFLRTLIDHHGVLMNVHHCILYREYPVMVDLRPHGEKRIRIVDPDEVTHMIKGKGARIRGTTEVSYGPPLFVGPPVLAVQ